jgi:hypothetical protein
MIAALLLVGCGSSSRPDANPATFDARPIDAPADDAPLCAPSGGCPSGPVCGASCCNAGEQCMSGVCMCSTVAACGVGDVCAAAGAQRPDMCGSICCGASGPCPGVTGP